MDLTDHQSQSGFVQSLYKGLCILDEIIEASGPQKLSDIIRRFDMDRASAFRFLQTLEQLGFLRKDLTTKEYDVGGKLYYWASRLREKTRIIDTYHTTLERLAAITGQTTHLGLFVNDRVLLADFAHSDSIIAVRHVIGGLEPLYSAAVGKAILAFLPQDRQEKLIKSLRFEKYTKNTIEDIDSLRINLVLVKQKGYAIDASEMHEGLTCIARPIFDSDGFPIASIGITCITALVSSDPGKFEQIIHALLSLSTEITGQSGEIEEPLFGSLDT